MKGSRAESSRKLKREKGKKWWETTRDKGNKT